MLGLNKVRASILFLISLKVLVLSLVLLFPVLSSGRQILPHECPEFYFSDLDSALRGFEENSSLFLAESYDVDLAEANLGFSKSEKGFRLGLSLNGQSIHEDRPSERFYHHYRTYYQLFLRKPLFHWGALNSKEQIAILDKERAVQRFSYRKRALEGQIRAMFLEMIVLKYRITVTHEQIKLAQENCDTIEEKLSLGVQSFLELEESKANLLKLQIKLLENEINLNKKRAQFVRVSGFKSSTELEIPDKFWDFVLRGKIQKQFPVQIGGLSSNELNHLRTQSSIESENVKIAEAELKPKINFMTSYYQDQIDLASNGQSIDRNNFIVGIEANWAIWDSHRSLSQKNAALAKRSKIDHLINLKIRELNDSVDSLRNEIISLIQRINLSRNLMSVAKNRLEKSTIELNLDQINKSQHFSSVLALDETKLLNLESVVRYMVLLDQYDLVTCVENSNKSIK